jgi:hypothetical protein
VSTEEPMSIEDRIRTATRAGATLVRDIGPLAAPEPTRLRRRPAPTARRWGTWGIPLAAAAAVVLVALSLVAVRQFGASAPATGGPATSPSATTVPRYYAVLDNSDETDTDNGPLIVGDDLTGKVIDTISPPHGLHFDHVEGASDDRTFVILASNQFTPSTHSPADKWYLVRIAPGTARPYQLTKLPIKMAPGSPNGIAYALSPDGTELAVESDNGAAKSFITLGIYSMSSGAELRAWSTTEDVVPGPVQEIVSWLSDGRQVAFSAALPNPERYQLRTLDVTGTGTDLMTASHPVVTTPLSGAHTCYSLHITPDGGTVICATQYAMVAGAGTNAGCANGGPGFISYSARTGKPEHILYRFGGACHNGISTLPWTNASGTEIIGATAVDVANQGGKETAQLAVITDGRIRLLSLPKSVRPDEYGIVVF